MKKIFGYFGIILLTGVISAGCGNQNTEDKIADDLNDSANEIIDDSGYSDDDSDFSVDENADNSDDWDSDGSSNDPEYMYNVDMKLDGNVVMTKVCTILLKTDGIVVSKGKSTFGELGNGERIDSDDWVYVNGLENIKKIYSDQEFGQYYEGDTERHVNGLCYALAENGNLYRWGANILQPELILQEVKDIKALNRGQYFLIEYEDGRREILANLYSYYNWTRIISDITESTSNMEIMYATSDDDSNLDIIVKDNNDECYVIGYELGETDNPDNILIDGSEGTKVYVCNISEIYRYEINEEIGSIECGELDESTGVYVLSNEGEVNNFNIENDGIVFLDEWDGKGYKAYFDMDFGSDEGSNSFGLLGGYVTTYGWNKYGQLGDGTYYDYYDDWLTVDEFECIDFKPIISYDGVACAALDTDGNLWCWGDNYSSSPSIEIAAGVSDSYIE